MQKARLLRLKMKKKKHLLKDVTKTWMYPTQNALMRARGDISGEWIKDLVEFRGSAQRRAKRK